MTTEPEPIKTWNPAEYPLGCGTKEFTQLTEAVNLYGPEAILRAVANVTGVKMGLPGAQATPERNFWFDVTHAIDSAADEIKTAVSFYNNNNVIKQGE